MSKKQMLSPNIRPEKYIKERARTLPLYKCLVNFGWKQNGLAQVAVLRKHVTGNVTVCFYLVDLMCLGIKDTYYHFNIQESEFEEMLDSCCGNLQFDEISYELAHNIIYAALSFSEELGFKQHKDFYSTTQYMLEEDTDDIPLIDIDCGKDGRPVYLQSELDSKARTNQILDQLDKSVGVGNYDFVQYDGAFDKCHHNGSYDRAFDEHINKSFEENQRILDSFFRSNKSSIEQADPDIRMKIFAIADILSDSIISEESLDMWNDRWADQLDNISINEDLVMEELLGLPKDIKISNTEHNKIAKLYNSNKHLPFIKKRWGDIPYVLYSELVEEDSHSDSFKEKLSEYLALYPDYPFFKILDGVERINEMILDGKYPLLDDYFGGRTVLATEEFTNFYFLILEYLSELGDLNAVEALCICVENLSDSYDEFTNILLAHVMSIRISLLLSANKEEELH